MFTTLDKSSEKSFYSVNSASVCLYWIQASVIVERGGEKDMLALLSLPPSLCCRLCRAVMFACIWERHSQPRRPSADISARKVTDEFGANLIIPDRIKMLPVKMLWHMDTLSPPMFFNNFTHTISFPTDAYFSCNPAWRWCGQLACTPEDTYATCDLFPFMHKHTAYSKLMSSAHSYHIPLAWSFLMAHVLQANYRHWCIWRCIYKWWPDAAATIMLTNYPPRCLSDVGLLAKATESIFFMHADRPAAGCYTDRGQFRLAVWAWFVLSPDFELRLLTYEYIYRPWKYSQESHHGERQKKIRPSRSNLDMANASFEHLRQIYPLVNQAVIPGPHSMQFPFVVVL